MQRPPSRSGAAALALLACVGLYHFALVYTLVFTKGLCCADDSAIAIVAKNLALGQGYATSLQHLGTPGLHAFDFGVSTGPTLILPASVLIRVFGNQPWVPGFATATLSLVLLALVFQGVAAVRGWRAACVFVSAFLLLAHCLTVWHFEHWYALLGEVPAALLAIAAVCRYGASPRSTSGLVQAGLLAGLAVLAKLLAALSFLPVVFGLLLAIVRDRSGRRGRLRELGIASGSFLSPLLAFEAWRFAALGPGGYLANLRQLVSFGQEKGVAADAGLAARVSQHFFQFTEHFGFSPLVLLVLSALSLAVLARSPERWAFRMALGLHAAGLTHLAWWLGFSLGRPRYVLVGLLLFAAGLALSAFGPRERAVKIALAAAIVAVHVPPRDRLLYPFRQARHPPVDRLTHLRETVELLNARRATSLPVYGSWTTIAELEFALPGVDNFRRIDKVGPGDIKPELLLVRNTFWRDFAKWTPVDEWEQGCAETVLDRPPFLVSRCPFETEKYKRLQGLLAHVIYHQTPAPAVRIRGGGHVDLFAHAPTTLGLDVPGEEQYRLVLAYGIDDEARGKGGSDGVCFVAAAISREGARSELLNDCLDLNRMPAAGGPRDADLALAPGTSRVILETKPRSGTDWDWSYWKEVELRPGG